MFLYKAWNESLFPKDVLSGIRIWEPRKAGGRARGLEASSFRLQEGSASQSGKVLS